MIFEKVGHYRVADAVVRQLEALVLEGVLRPGDRLPPERELAEALDVSRPTLREALSVLEGEGLVTARQGGGTYVAGVTGSVFSEPMVRLFARHHEATRDYLEFRAEVESAAAGLAARRASPADRAILSRIVERMGEAHAAGDPDEEARLDVEFHIAISDASHNIVMIQTLRSIYNLLVHGVFQNRTMLFGRDDARNRLLEQHRAIYDAIIAGEPEAAATAARSHMVYVAAALAEVELARAREETADRRLDQFEAARRVHPLPRKRSA